MSTVTLQFKLPYDNAIKVLRYIDTLTDATSDELHQEAQTPVEEIEEATPQVNEVDPINTYTTVKPTAGKKISMPTLGRTNEQIDIFVNKEQERFDAKSDEELAKEQRTIDKAIEETIKTNIVNDIKAPIVEAEIKKVHKPHWLL